MNNDRQYWNAINLLPNVGPACFRKLRRHFSAMQQAWQASPAELELAGLDRKIVESFSSQRQKISPAAEMEKLVRENIAVITIQDKNYPPLLKEISSAPALLYVQGEIPCAGLTLAIVGTRRATAYGQQITADITKQLVKHNFTIISGLAQGIDTYAHHHALENNGATVAVIASGLDKNSVYPYTNRQLAKRIAQQGALVSEYPLGTPSLPQHFPIRNRIIAGLAQGVLIVEAPKKSGALITANFAVEQNREVFAIPGNINHENSAGPNNLIKLGAKLVSGVEDILEEFNIVLNVEPAVNKNVVLNSIEEKKLFSYLSQKPIHIDKLAEISHFNASIVSSTLVLMEIKGQVKNLGGMRYVVNN